ncbi:hypothetical protein Ciccas_008986, partial [Cichlidogyrus casuarinus]
MSSESVHSGTRIKKSQLDESNPFVDLEATQRMEVNDAGLSEELENLLLQPQPTRNVPSYRDITRINNFASKDVWAKAVRWFSAAHSLDQRLAYQLLALLLTCVNQTNERRDVIEGIVVEAEYADKPFESLLEAMVSLTRRIAEKDMVTILERIKSSDEPPSVKYRRLGAITADETQQLNLWKGMLGQLTLRFVSLYQN